MIKPTSTLGLVVVSSLAASLALGCGQQPTGKEHSAGQRLPIDDLTPDERQQDKANG